MEIEHCSMEPPLGQGRNKDESKDFLEFSENKFGNVSSVSIMKHFEKYRYGIL